MIWDSLPGQIATWAAAIAAWSAAVAGLIYLSKVLWQAIRYTRNLGRALGRLMEIGDTEVWPNGSDTLAETIGGIHADQKMTHSKLDDLEAAIRSLHPDEGAAFADT